MEKEDCTLDIKREVNENDLSVDVKIEPQENILDEEDFFEVEFLEDHEFEIDQDDKEITESHTLKSQSSTENSAIANNKSQVGIEKRINRKGRKYNYTEEELSRAIELVRSKRMKIAEAVKYFNIPVSSLKHHLYRDSISINAASQKDVLKKKNLVQEVRNLLSYTNAVPFKALSGRLYCAYCTTKGPEFDSMETLRSHTVTEHTRHRIQHAPKVTSINEIANLEITDLICTVCHTPILEWSDMFRHLSEHDLEFDEAYKRVVPYRIKDKFKCALCNVEFINFYHLGLHMNSHYNNHICHECGDTFLTFTRLSRHIKSHEVGKYPCEKCGKVFTLDKYRVKHTMYVHHRTAVYKCSYCPSVFKILLARHNHILEEHKERVDVIACQFCPKKFNFRPYYYKHLKRIHRRDKAGNKLD